MKKLIAILLICTMVLSCGIVASAEESSFVTYSDGYSYEGLPEFPEYSKVYYNNLGNRYTKYTEYILYYSSSESKYYLICMSGEGGSIYLDSNNKLCYSGVYYRYTNESLSNYDATYNGSVYVEYTCPDGGTSWSKGGSYNSNGTLSVAHRDKLVQSSANIYKDSSLATVFTKPTAGPLMLGMSSATIVEMMMMEVVGLVPSVIGLIILLTAFWMAYRLLSRELLKA